MTDSDEPQFFELVESDTGDTFAWLDVPHLQHGVPINIWMFSQCQPLNLDKPVEIEIDEPGAIADLNYTAFNVPVVSLPAAQIIAELAPTAVQVLDAIVKQTDEQMAVLNVLDDFNCIDHQASKMTYVEKDDKFSNRKAGDPETVFSLRIDPSTVRDQMIFRISGYRQALIFHEQLVHALRDASLSGVALVEV